MQDIQQFISKAETLIEAMPYIADFKAETIVVKLGGSVMDNATTLKSILEDVAFMRVAGMLPIVVHGGGKAISRALAEAGVETKFVMGLRVTDEASIKVVERVIKNEVNAEVVEILRSFDIGAEPLHGDTIFLSEKKTGKDPATGAALDWGFVGNPVFTDTGPAREMLSRRVVPVVCPLGRSAGGELHNINADTAAAALAKALKARKLAFVSDVPGLLENPADPSTLINTLKAADAPALMSRGVVGGGMLPKIQSCLDALDAGVRKVHLVDGRMPHSLLLEIFTNKGVGTEITK
ncbi:MAG: acetylglutamate kinase [Kiritimatiellaeota bacterium]|nr:acetylglutamate kinase [Kiritimatiellota bacterium]